MHFNDIGVTLSQVGPQAQIVARSSPFPDLMDNGCSLVKPGFVELTCSRMKISSFDSDSFRIEENVNVDICIIS